MCLTHQHFRTPPVRSMALPGGDHQSCWAPRSIHHLPGLLNEPHFFQPKPDQVSAGLARLGSTSPRPARQRLVRPQSERDWFDIRENFTLVEQGFTLSRTRSQLEAPTS
jgi:hypothetical protein